MRSPLRPFCTAPAEPSGGLERAWLPGAGPRRSLGPGVRGWGHPEAKIGRRSTPGSKCGTSGACSPSCSVDPPRAQAAQFTATPLRSQPLVLGLLSLALLTACAQEAPPPPLCLLVSIDTLRADALSCYGGPAGSSPELDALANAGLRFESVYAQAPNTATSHASLFTGLLPFAHRVANITSLEHGTPGLAPGFETLAECFAEGSWDTAAFSDDGPLGKGWNLMQGFERLEAKLGNIDTKVDGILRHLDERQSTQPLFLFVHTYEVHEPFAPSAADLEAFDTDYAGPLRAVWSNLRARIDAGEALNDGRALLKDADAFGQAEADFLRALYQAEVHATDRALGRLLDGIEQRCGADQALLAITSDHGEEFGEHKKFGHEQLFGETLRVPLILRLPGQRHAGRVISQPIAQFDLMPSLLELCGLPIPAPIEAQSFVNELDSGTFAERELIAETTEGLYAPTTHLDQLRARRSSGFAYLERNPSPDPSAPRRDLPHLPYGGSLFDLSQDPGEQSPVHTPSNPGSPRHRGLADAAHQRLNAQRQKSESLALQWATGHSLLPADQATVEQLKRLGYLPGE